MKAIFFDIDGTLRDFASGRIPESAKKALEAAREAGLLLFVATGRHALEIEEENLMEGLAFDGYVTLNGQYCFNGSQVIYRNPISRDQVAIIVERAEEEGFPCLFMEGDRMYINRVNDLVAQVQAGIGTRLPPIQDIKRALGQDIYQVIPYVDEEQGRRLMEGLTGCETTKWHEAGAYDIAPLGGNKSIGMEKVLAFYGLGPEEAAAVGDGNNDVAMLSYAGLGIAMGNAKPAAKAAADHVVGTIGEDGLSQAVFHILRECR